MLVFAALWSFEKIGQVSWVRRRWLVSEEYGLWRDAGLQTVASQALVTIELKLWELDGNFGGAVLVPGVPRPEKVRDLLSYIIDMTWGKQRRGHDGFQL